MTGGFYTIINMPYEGALITEYSTKAEALKAHNDNIKQVDLNPDPTNGIELLGAAIVHIEVVDEKGEWKEGVIRNE